MAALAPALRRCAALRYRRYPCGNVIATRQPLRAGALADARCRRRGRRRSRARSRGRGRCRCPACRARGRSARAPARARPAECRARRLRPRANALAVARAGAHRDAAAARRVLERVVHQVGERLAQQEGVAVDRRAGSSSKPRSMSRASAWCTQASASPSTTLFRSTLRRVAARAGLGARQREQLVGEPRGADRRLVHLLELRARPPRAAAARARARCAPAARRAACAAGARRWRGSAAGCGSPRHLLEQAVQRADQRPRLLRRAGGVDRAQVARRALLDLLGQARERREAALDAEPDDDQRRQREQQLAAAGSTAGSRAPGACASPWSRRPARCRSPRPHGDCTDTTRTFWPVEHRRRGPPRRPAARGSSASPASRGRRGCSTR